MNACVPHTCHLLSSRIIQLEEQIDVAKSSVCSAPSSQAEYTWHCYNLYNLIVHDVQVWQYMIEHKATKIEIIND